MLNEGPIQPLERTVGLAPERVRLGDLDGPIVLESLYQLCERHVSFLFPPQSVIDKSQPLNAPNGLGLPLHFR